MSSRPAHFIEDTVLQGFGLGDQSDERWGRRDGRRRRANAQQSERRNSGNSTGSGRGGDVEAAVVDSLTDEVVSQMQQLTVGQAAVGTSGGRHEQPAARVDSSPGHSNSGRNTEHDSWIFLDNAAQVFGRSPELKEVTDLDIRKGYDSQGYYWRGNLIQKEVYMGYRKRMYPRHQYVEHSVKQVRKMGKCIDTVHSFYKFRYSAIGDDFRSQIGHFQHRDMLWATSSYDVFYCHSGSVCCWNPWQRMARRSVLGRSQMPKAFKVRSMCVDSGVVFVGDGKGDYCVKALRTDTGSVAAGSLVAGAGEDAVNHASPATTRSGTPHIVCSLDSGAVRSLDVSSLSVAKTSVFDWPVHCSSLVQDGTLQCVVGDSTDALLIDPRCDSGDHVAQLVGHQDYSFSCAFSPNGRLVATGSQDTSIRVYDVRRPQQTLATLCGYIGAMRVVRFSGCGRFLLGMESADYVHVYDAQSFARAQVVSFMGETAGATFSPDSNCLFLAVSDSIHGSSLAEHSLTSVDTEGVSNPRRMPF
ncbi:hypothetical protein LPJ59_001880 [Coemansia sp. RSA 2399]|nr:hypothetical protein LPJ59_001880 [Coemansia sp. RSA 2399]